MSLNELKKKIKSTQGTAQITRAMQLVSNNKYHRMVAEAENYFTYNNELRKLVVAAVKKHRDLSVQPSGNYDVGEVGYSYPDFFSDRKIKKSAYLVITSDRGLAGSYNSSVIREVDQLFQARSATPDNTVVMAVGMPIVKYCRSKGYPIAYELHNLPDYPNFTNVQHLIRTVIKLYKQDVFDELFLCYNHHINALTNEMVVKRMLPMDRVLDSEDDGQAGVEYLLEPSPAEVLEVLVPQYAESLMYGAFIDAKTAEQASRMSAMKSATENADEMIQQLQLDYQKQRQMNLTNEVIEIINGAVAQDASREPKAQSSNRRPLTAEERQALLERMPAHWIAEYQQNHASSKTQA